jgi:Fe-S-cluster containining protein
MNPCDECSIDDKVYNCCGRYPETGETACMNNQGPESIYSCPYLNNQGACSIYENRPLGCKTFFCSRFEPYCFDWEHLDYISIWLKNDS